MILSQRDKKTRNSAVRKRVKAFSGFERSARLKLGRIEAATAIRDLVALPGNRFEVLAGDRRGGFRIRIDDQMANLLRMGGRSSRALRRGIVDFH